jgi:hypothetical protein
MKKCTEYTLGKTIISSEYDQDGNHDYYGTYGDKYKPGCIVRADDSFYEDHINDDEYEPETMHREYSFFYPTDTGEKIGTELYRKYALENYKRVEDLNSNQWCYIGLIAETTVHIDGTLSDTISDALWGIESDSGKDYLNSTIDELKESVKEQLRALGFSDEEINASVDNAETKKGEMYL